MPNLPHGPLHVSTRGPGGQGGALGEPHTGTADRLGPIPGTERVAYLEENAAATDVRLTDDDLRRLDEAAPAGATAGDRYADMSTVHR